MTEKMTNLGKSILSGRYLLALGVDRFLDRIVFFFVCAIGFIWINIQIDRTLHIKEENRIALENLQSMHTYTTCKLTSLNSVCEVEKMLQDMGSKLQLPQKRATRIK